MTRHSTVGVPPSERIGRFCICVAVLTDETHYLLETKGREDPDLTGTPWRFLKVPQKEHEALEPTDFADLMVFARS